MRIALDVQSTAGKPTGIGQYTARLLAALQHVAPGNIYVQISWHWDPVMRLQNRLLWQQMLSPHQARRAQPDILHVPGFDAPVWRPCPVVLTCHDLIGKLFPQNLPPVSRFYWSRWLPWSLRFADAIIADSEATRRDIMRLTTVPGDRITVTPLGVDAHFHPVPFASQEIVRTRYQLPEHYLLYVGTLEPRKGVDTLIDAFAQLTIRFPEHHLVLGGKKGWYWEPILRAIEEHRLDARVHVTGYVADEDLPALYSAAAVFVLPSRYEGFGLPVLEAMACGVPVVCSNSSSLPEVAGDAGLQVPPDSPDRLAQALAAVLENPALAEDMRDKGLAQARRFTWERTAQATLEVYRQVYDAHHR
jgi:glycosyltransferase involved in cell wall biosynthesis